MLCFHERARSEHLSSACAYVLLLSHPKATHEASPFLPLIYSARLPTQALKLLSRILGPKLKAKAPSQSH